MQAFLVLKPKYRVSDFHLHQMTCISVSCVFPSLETQKWPSHSWRCIEHLFCSVEFCAEFAPVRGKGSEECIFHPFVCGTDLNYFPYFLFVKFRSSLYCSALCVVSWQFLGTDVTQIILVCMVIILTVPITNQKRIISSFVASILHFNVRSLCKVSTADQDIAE
jgi:hypothetical protein